MLCSCKDRSTPIEQIKNISGDLWTAKEARQQDGKFLHSESCPMLSVIIPTEGVEQTVVITLAVLVPGAAAGLVREVLLVDRASTDVMERVADVAGCRLLRQPGSRAAAMAAGARQARSPWLLFLRAGAVLDPGWMDETAHFIQRVSIGGRSRAGIFRYARSPYSDAGL